MTCAQGDLRRFLLRLAPLQDDARHDAITDEVVRTGGTMIWPKRGGKWHMALIDLQLYGLSATGADSDEAVTNWLRIAGAEVARIERVEAATNVLDGRLAATPDHFRRACATIISDASDLALILRAQSVITTLSANSAPPASHPC